MGKGNGSTRASSSGSPRGLSEGANGQAIDLSRVYKLSGMLDMDYSKAPRLTLADFTDEDEYTYMTKPMDLDVNIQKVQDFWNRGLTGGESGIQLREAKRAIIDAIKANGGGEIKPSQVSWDKDLNEFVAYHPVKNPGDVAKSYWKIDSMTQTVRFAKSKRSGSIYGADKYGEDLYQHTATHNYKVKVRGTGVKAY